MVHLRLPPVLRVSRTGSAAGPRPFGRVRAALCFAVVVPRLLGAAWILLALALAQRRPMDGEAAPAG